MARTIARSCAACGGVLTEKLRGAKFCSEVCRKRSDRRKKLVKQTRNPDAAKDPRVLDGGDEITDTNGGLVMNLILSNPRWARTSPEGRVLCPACDRPTRQEPILLRVPDTDIIQVVPVYHAECRQEE